MNQIYLVSEKLNKVCMALNYIGPSFILVCLVTTCFSIPAFASLARIPIGIKSSAEGLKIFAITAASKHYQPII